MRLVGEADHVTRQLTSLVSLSQCISSVRPLISIAPASDLFASHPILHLQIDRQSIASSIHRRISCLARSRHVFFRAPPCRQTSGRLSRAKAIPSIMFIYHGRTDGRTEADGGATRGRGDTTAICAAAAATRKVAGCGAAAPRFLEILPSHGTILALHFPSIVVPSTFFATAVIWREKAVVVGRSDRAMLAAADCEGRCFLSVFATDGLSRKDILKN